MSVDYIESRRTGKLLIYNNYIYRLDKRRHKREYWKCRTSRCTARLTLENGNINNYNEDSPINIHNHEPENNAIAVKTFKQQVKQDIRQNPLKTVPEIYNDARARILQDSPSGSSQSEGPAMPSLNSVIRCLYRERRYCFPSEPESCADLIIDGVWSKTLDHKSFLLASEGSNDKIVLFGSEDFLQKICSADVVFFDGTLKACPKIFSQLYCIYCIYGEKLYPSLFALLPNRETSTSIRLLDIIRNTADVHGTNFNPNIFYTDFESGMVKAISESFPNSKIYGSFFHFTRNIWRKIAELGLCMEFQNNHNLKTLVKRVSALPLVPEASLDEAWAELLTAANPLLDVRGTRFVEYVFNTWISENAPFEKSVWCRFENDDLRANYHMEECYYKLNRRICKKLCPSIYELIGFLQQQQQDCDTDMKLYENEPPVSQNKRYRNIHRKLFNMKEKFINKQLELINFLDLCGELVQLQE